MAAPALFVQSAEVAAVHAASRADITKKLYMGSLRRLFTWMKENYPMLLVEQYRSFDVASLKTVDVLKSVGFPFTQEFNQNIFEQYLTALRTRTNKPLEPTSLNAHRAALNFVYLTFSVETPRGYASSLKTYFAGAKRQSAKRKQDGDGKVEVGKKPLSFELYRFICCEFLKSSDSGAIFAQTVLTICWNLMCRAGNAASICFSHMSWKEDSLAILFAQMKNDQDGEQKVPRHVYANPLIPEISPILSLGIYFLCFKFEAAQVKLFHGSNQFDRYSKALKAILNQPVVAAKLKELGVESGDIGTHSLRKGSATYVASGTTASPPSVALHNRAGWKLGQTLDRYLHYEAAGDHFVGRTVCGLPPLSPDFAILPPFWSANATPQQQAAIAEAITDCFPLAPESFSPLLRFGLASVIYHESFLRKTLPSNHPLFVTPLFCNSDRFKLLLSAVECRRATLQDHIQPTGIPPIVIVLEFLEKLTSAVGQLTPNLLKGFEGLLEHRAVEAGNLTPSAFEGVLRKSIQEYLSPLMEKINRLEHPPGVQSSAPPM